MGSLPQGVPASSQSSLVGEMVLQTLCWVSHQEREASTCSVPGALTTNLSILQDYMSCTCTARQCPQSCAPTVGRWMGFCPAGAGG